MHTLERNNCIYDDDEGCDVYISTFLKPLFILYDIVASTYNGNECCLC